MPIGGRTTASQVNGGDRHFFKEEGFASLGPDRPQGSAVNDHPPPTQTFARDLQPIEKFEATVSTLQKLRRAVAPPGSLREAVLRRLYAPFLTALPKNPFDPDRLPQTMQAEIVTLHDPAVVNFHPIPINRIIVVKLDHIGDMIIGMRAMHQLRQAFPGAHITLLCASWNRSLAEQTGMFDEIHSFDFFPALHRDWTAPDQPPTHIYDMIRELPLSSYDLAIDLRHDPDTRPCLYRISAKFRVGFEASPEPGQPPLDLMLPSTEAFAAGDAKLQSLHADLRLQLLAAGAIATFAPKPPHPLKSLVPPPEIQPARRRAILAIGAGDPIRVWPMERYAEVARHLIGEHGLDIVILGGPAEQQDADRLKTLLAPLPSQSAIGLPLDQLPAYVAGAALCICNGSGISHMAAALGVPTICILGGTSRMEVWHPGGANAVSLGGRTMCQPCGLKHPSDCPWQVACLSIIQPAHVLAACAQILPRSPPPCGEG
jgi:ADP-heptose:LPS heptosyltransferase